MKLTIWSTWTFYIKKHNKFLILFLLCTTILGIIFFLSSIPLDVVLYGFLLCGVLISIFTLYDFYLFSQKHQTLLTCQKQTTMDLDCLPLPDNLIELDYQNLLFALLQNQTELISLADQKQSDMIDYYTIWAHQIKTPIAALNLLLQTEDELSKKEIQQELFKIEQYAQMVLQYLRIDHISSDLKLQHYNLSTLIKQAIKKYSMIFIHKKIQLDFMDCTIDVLTDEKWLVFVIEQILSNALKYTSKGKISIYMDYVQEKTLIIEDTGIGIQEEDLPRICERGYTGYNGRMDKKSTGIGLYLCKEILNKLSHKLYITSQVGVGTKVHIDLSSSSIRDI